MMQILQRNLVDRVGSRSVHSISKRDVIDLVNAVVDRGSPVAANKSLKVVKSSFNWCVGRAIVERSPCEGVRARTVERRETACSRIGSSQRSSEQPVNWADPYGAIVEVLALTGQRRDEVGRMSSDEVDLDHRLWTLPATGAVDLTGLERLAGFARRLREYKRGGLTDKNVAIIREVQGSDVWSSVVRLPFKLIEEARRSGDTDIRPRLR